MFLPYFVPSKADGDKLAKAIQERDHYAAALEDIVARGSGTVPKGSFAHQLVEIAKEALRPIPKD